MPEEETIEEDLDDDLEEEIEEEDSETVEEPKAEPTETRGGFEREMHKAVCSDCGKDCEVPFKPIEGRAIYCRDCYQKHRPPRRNRRF